MSRIIQYGIYGRFSIPKGQGHRSRIFPYLHDVHLSHCHAKNISRGVSDVCVSFLRGAVLVYQLCIPMHMRHRAHERSELIQFTTLIAAAVNECTGWFYNNCHSTHMPVLIYFAHSQVWNQEDIVLGFMHVMFPVIAVFPGLFIIAIRKPKYLHFWCACFNIKSTVCVSIRINPMVHVLLPGK